MFIEHMLMTIVIYTVLIFSVYCVSGKIYFNLIWYVIYAQLFYFFYFFLAGD